MGPGTPTLTYREIAKRSGANMDDVILGIDELQRTGKVVTIHFKGDVNRQQAFRTSP
jgi:hypothetical protein